MSRGGARIVQIHPTLRCNLTCRHCYSESGPQRSEVLPIDVLRAAVSDARDEGYNVVSVSGGEPLLYRELPALLGHAKGLGLFTTVTTNGTVTTERRLAAVSDSLDLLAISLDGIPESHDEMRGAGSFARMERRMQFVRECGIAFGFIFTLTQHNLHELGWVLDFCLEQGAALLQIHPLEGVGRASEELPESLRTRERWRSHGSARSISRRRPGRGSACRSTSPTCAM